MKNTVERFSNRVENYVKYRPTYPADVLDLFKNEMGLTKESVIADIGSGPGISSRLFVENGNTVYGVEPNEAMRQAAEEYFQRYNNFKSTNGTAENTGLPNGSVDFLIAAQAFHWFDQERARAEFKRILKPGGYAALMWNIRQMDTTPFLRDYEQFLLKFGTDYTVVRHENVTLDDIEKFFQKPFATASFKNVQVHDLDGLKGRALSASYVPSEADPVYPQMIDELSVLFEKHQSQGKIEIIYDTNVYYTKF
jgi:SAM-dependent methyltransferase